ncbi:MAG: OmpA family protein [Magnetococcales bacterium]|nr:OmpA family protein [Magnetococcales bacterium]
MDSLSRTVYHAIIAVCVLALMCGVTENCSSCVKQQCWIPAKPKSYVVLMEGFDGKVGKVIFKGGAGEQVLDQAGMAGGIDQRGKVLSHPVQMNVAEVEKTFREVLAAAPMPPMDFILYFMAGTDKLTPESEQSIPQILANMSGRAAPEIAIIGHTDRVGNDQTNYQLAFKRAEAVKQIFVDHGVASQNVTVTSHGESNPLVPTEDNVPEPRNRRVQATVR